MRLSNCSSCSSTIAACSLFAGCSLIAGCSACWWRFPTNMLPIHPSWTSSRCSAAGGASFARAKNRAVAGSSSRHAGQRGAGDEHTLTVHPWQMLSAIVLHCELHLNAPCPGEQGASQHMEQSLCMWLRREAVAYKVRLFCFQ